VHRLRPLAALATFLALLVAAARPAPGHPHMWVDTAATFVFAQGRLAAVRIEWTFDDMFSESLLGSYDKNRNKRFEAAEVRELRANAFDSLKDVGFFTRLHAGGKAVAVPSVSDFGVTVAEGRVIYRFTVGLQNPVDPVATPVRLAVYDPTYFAQMTFVEKGPVRFEGKPGGTCQHEIREDTSTPLYFGTAFPQEVRLRCQRP
jgi:ABC-type uncharacterized transport system substrate-binding protein